MSQDLSLRALLDRLTELCPGGYAIALHIKFATPTHLFQTYPEEWNAIYTERALVMKDPTVHWGFANSGPMRWRDLEAQDNEGVIALAREHGLAHGVTVALNDGGSRTVSSFVQTEREHSEDEVVEIEGLVRALHLMTLDEDRMEPADLKDLYKLTVNAVRKGPTH